MNDTLLQNMKQVYTEVPDLPILFSKNITSLISRSSLTELLIVVLVVGTMVFVGNQLKNKVPLVSATTFEKLLTPLFICIFGFLLVATNKEHIARTPLWLYLVITITFWQVIYQSVLKFILPTFSSRTKNIYTAIHWLTYFLWITDKGQTLLKLSQNVTIAIGKYKFSFFTLTIAIFWSGIAFLFALWLGRYIESKIMQMGKIDENFKIVISKILKFLLIFISVTIILPIFGIDITTLTVLGGAFVAGLAFSLKNIVSNYISGFIILLDQSVRIHDRITMGNFTGL